MYICNTCAGFRNIVLVLWQLEQWMESLQKHIFAQRIKTGTSQDLLRINQHSCAVLYSRLEVITVVNKIQYEVGFLLTSFPFQLASHNGKEIPQPPRDDLPADGTGDVGQRFAVCVHEQFELSYMRIWRSIRHVYSFLLLLTSHHFRLNHLEASSNGCGLRIIAPENIRMAGQELTRFICQAVSFWTVSFAHELAHFESPLHVRRDRVAGRGSSSSGGRRWWWWIPAVILFDILDKNCEEKSLLCVLWCVWYFKVVKLSLIIFCYINYFDHSVYDAAMDAEMVMMMAFTLGWTPLLKHWPIYARYTMPNPTQFTDWGYPT